MSFKASLEQGMDGPEVVVDIADSVVPRIFMTVNYGTYMKLTVDEAVRLRNALSLVIDNLPEGERK